MVSREVYAASQVEYKIIIGQIYEVSKQLKLSQS